jgi:hypothetical protein
VPGIATGTVTVGMALGAATDRIKVPCSLSARLAQNHFL